VQITPLRTRRFLRKIIYSETGCLLWTGAVAPNGYGRLGESAAHRFSYELWIGPIPAGLVIDHLCRVRRCVNPMHLEAVTSRENILRGVGPTAQKARQTHCKYGHELSGANLRVRADGGRDCRRCSVIRSLEHKRRKSAA
jgi:hypothetical protein